MSGPGGGVPTGRSILDRQIPLSLSLQERASFDNFHISQDSTVVALLQAMASGDGPHLLYLWGGNGAGKSHLLHAACNLLGSGQGRAIVLPLKTLYEQGASALDGVGQYDLVALDDLDAIIGDKAWEEALFHLLNALRDSNNHVLITANGPLAELDFQIPDLRSRVGEGVVEHLNPLEDREKWQVLQERAASRGMEMGDDVVTFLMSRTSRDFHTLFSLLDRLDEQTLIAQRRITIPFVKELLSL